jgi:hypothetical protein
MPHTVNRTARLAAIAAALGLSQEELEREVLAIMAGQSHEDFTKQGLRLLRAFGRIPDPRTRSLLVELVDALAPGGE